MVFIVSDELKERIRKNVSDTDLKNALLLGNESAITNIGIVSQRGIPSEEIIKSYESGNLDSLYNKAKKMLELQKIYKDLCNEHAACALNIENDETNKIKK